MEMTLRHLQSPGEQVVHSDFLARVDVLRALGWTVMVTNYSRFHSVTSYLRRYTQERVGLVMGVPTLAQLLDLQHYTDLGGGVLEAFGRLFTGPVKLYIYPWRNQETGEFVRAETFMVADRLRHLYAYLLQNKFVESLEAPSNANLSVMPGQVYALIQAGDPTWERLVPPEVVEVIKEKMLFDCCRPGTAAGA
jgi:hypothetical protein